MNEQPLGVECGTQDAQVASSPYPTTNAVGLDPDPIQVADSGDSATGSSSTVPIELNDRGRILSHHISQTTGSSIYGHLLAGVELVKEIHLLHSVLRRLSHCLSCETLTF